MERLNVKSLLLEVTRNCNLECKHCFRGDSENKYMSLDLIDMIFNEVCRINEFYLTGGEPLLATNQVERIMDNIKKERINIGNLSVVTNGTVLSDDLISMFEEIDKRSNLEFIISNDVFHESEIRSKKLNIKTYNNIQRLKSKFRVSIPEEKVFIIDKIGRARKLTDEKVKEICSISSTDTKYVLGNEKTLKSFRSKINSPKLIEAESLVDGTISIDVNGNVTPTYYSYKDEDKFKSNNIQKAKSLKKVLKNINL